MPDDAERNPPIQEQMDGGELVRTRTVQDRQRGPAGCSGGILDAAQAPPRLDTDAHAPAPNAQSPHPSLPTTRSPSGHNAELVMMPQRSTKERPSQTARL